MVRVPTPEEEDRRRIGRERKTLVGERTEHVNRIKGLLFSQGVADYEPLRRDRRARLDELRTGDGRPLPHYLKAQIDRELDLLELLIDKIKAVEADRDALVTPGQEGKASGGSVLGSKAGMTCCGKRRWRVCLLRRIRLHESGEAVTIRAYGNDSCISDTHQVMLMFPPPSTA